MKRIWLEVDHIFTLKFLTHKEMKMHMQWNGHCLSKYYALEQTRDLGHHFLLFFHKCLRDVTICAKDITEVQTHFNQKE